MISYDVHVLHESHLFDSHAKESGIARNRSISNTYWRLPC